MVHKTTLRIAALNFSEDELLAMGLTKATDGGSDPRGHWWEISRGEFTLTVDAWGDVELSRLGCPPITLLIEDIEDLREAVQWIN